MRAARTTLHDVEIMIFLAAGCIIHSVTLCSVKNEGGPPGPCTTCNGALQIVGLFCNPGASWKALFCTHLAPGLGPSPAVLTECALLHGQISMVDGDMLDSLEEVARSVRHCKQPFGGLQLVLTGDFHQLPPVAKGRQAMAGAHGNELLKTVCTDEKGCSRFCIMLIPVQNLCIQYFSLRVRVGVLGLAAFLGMAEAWRTVPSSLYTLIEHCLLGPRVGPFIFFMLSTALDCPQRGALHLRHTAGTTV